jgi:hypothetical protein
VRHGLIKGRDLGVDSSVMEANAFLRELVHRNTEDEGYFSPEQICGLQADGIRTIIGDPHAAKRREDKQDPALKCARAKAARAVKSAGGKALLRKRGQHLERRFAHLLDHGGLRQATLRGKGNLTKRHLAAALTFNLSLLMRHLTGHGTPKQWAAAAQEAFFSAFFSLWCRSAEPKTSISARVGKPLSDLHHLHRALRPHPFRGPCRFSTGC